jgi:DivIVA domain-containing protein
MPLTAAEVRATQFATTRMRSGYDMDEVDAFLDIIEADVAQYADELQRSRDGEAVLRTQCDQLQVRVTTAEERLAAAQEQAATRGAVATVVAAEAPRVSEDLSAHLGDNPDAAAVLAAAQATADEIIRHAQARADAITTAVRRTLDEQRALLDR